MADSVAVKEDRFDADTIGITAGSEFGSNVPQLDPQVETYMTPHRTKVIVRCDACNLEFSSQTVLDSHFAGSKHQKKVSTHLLTLFAYEMI